MSSFGDLFARSARAPLEVSSKMFNDAHMGDGLRALDKDKLVAALREGTVAVATLVGLPVVRVEQELPQVELQAVLDRIHKRQEKALKSVRRQEMTVATFALPSEFPEADTPSAHLTVLSQTFARDKDISSSFRDLAFEVAAFEALLTKCTASLNDNALFQQTLRRRVVVRRLLIGGGVALAVLSAGGAVAALMTRAEQQRREAESKAREEAIAAQARSRIDAALALADPCVPDGLAEGDQPRLTEEQRAKLSRRAELCADQKRKAEAEKKCAQLAEHVTAGQLSPDDVAFVGQAEAALRRVASRTLTPADLLLSEADLPCAGSPAQQQIWAQLARGATAPTLWGLADGVSAPLVKVLSQPGVLPNPTILAIAFRAEKMATHAIKTNADADVRHAYHFCALKTALNQAHALSCQRISKTSPAPP